MRVGGRLLPVSGRQPVGVALGKESRVLATVVADRDGSSAEVDDLDQVRMADLCISVLVVAAMNRNTVQAATGSVDCSGFAPDIDPAPPEIASPASSEPLPGALGDRAKGRTAPTNGAASIG